jgi:hypothetical protein
VKVIINSWVGDKFINDNKCHICDKLVTTIEVKLPGYYDTWLVVCKSCLLDMSAEIDRKILESKTYETN